MQKKRHARRPVFWNTYMHIYWIVQRKINGLCLSNCLHVTFPSFWAILWKMFVLTLLSVSPPLYFILLAYNKQILLPDIIPCQLFKYFIIIFVGIKFVIGKFTWGRNTIHVISNSLKSQLSPSRTLLKALALRVSCSILTSEADQGTPTCEWVIAWWQPRVCILLITGDQTQ